MKGSIMKAVKKVRLFAMALTFAWVNALAFNPDVDLKNANVVAEGQCDHEGTLYKCFILEKNNKKYIVAVGKGVRGVYLIKSGKLQDSYTEDELELVWTVEPQRRKGEVSV